jgi:hypothetical protein
MEMEYIFRTFYVDLDKLNKEGAEKVHSELEYSMRESYGLDKLDANGMNELLERMRTNQSLFDNYILHNRVMYWDPNVTHPERFYYTNDSFQSVLKLN